VRALGLRTVLPANWAAGLAAAAAAGTFVSPPVRGFVLVTGSDLQRHSNPDEDLLPLLERLSRQFGRACWFVSDSERDVHGWVRAEGGAIERAYAYVVDRGHLLMAGEITDCERALGCFVDDARDGSDDEVKWWPDRRIVHALAAAWAVDPDRLDAGTAVPGSGYFGRW